MSAVAETSVMVAGQSRGLITRTPAPRRIEINMVEAGGRGDDGKPRLGAAQGTARRCAGRASRRARRIGKLRRKRVVVNGPNSDRAEAAERRPSPPRPVQGLGDDDLHRAPRFRWQEAAFDQRLGDQRGLPARQY